MSRPVVCPAGSICDTMNLRIPQKSCPDGFYCQNATKASSASLFQNLATQYDNQNAWILNDITGVLYFNYSILNYNDILYNYPGYGNGTINHKPELQCDGFSCQGGTLNVIAEAPFPCPLGHYCRTGVGSQIPLPKNFSTPQRCYDGFFCEVSALSY